eukprot:9398310-Karenia_brevis.AAC.1
MKITIDLAEQQPTVEQYRANIAEGSGEHLPAIMGLLSMTAKDSVIILSQQFVFPGPGGYRIEWSPGPTIPPVKESP